MDVFLARTNTPSKRDVILVQICGCLLLQLHQRSLSLLHAETDLAILADNQRLILKLPYFVARHGIEAGPTDCDLALSIASWAL